MRSRACLLAALLLPLATWAAPPREIARAFTERGVPMPGVAIVVQEAGALKPLFTHQPDVAMSPGSVMKLVTTFAALEVLGRDHRWRTDAYLDGTLADGTLDGNLVLVGGGDPKITLEQWDAFVASLRDAGLAEITGDLVLDRSLFGLPPHDPGAFDGEPLLPYNVGPDALLVNFKAVDFRFVPAGTGVRVLGEPDFPNVEIASRVKAVAGPCNNWRRGLQYEVEENGLLATVVFSGTYPAECGEKTWPLSVFDADRYTESAFRWLWSEAGGRFLGKVRAGAAPAGAALFLRFESEPLGALVRDMNKFSNNVMARQLFLALSAEKGGGPGEYAASARLVRDWLAARRIDAPGLSIENGSGLSRTDRIAPATLGAILRAAWASPVMPELVASLSLFAVDGTFKLRNGASAGSAHLKGGTLTGVQAVAGFVLAENGERRVVVMIANHDNANRAQPAMDALVDWVYRKP